MKLFFMLEGNRGSDVPGPIFTEVFELLSRGGFDIEWAKPEEMLSRCDLLKSESDLYLLRSNTELSLSIAGILYAQGARLLNPYPSCIATKDKIIASHLLQAADIPTPQTWVTGDPNLLSPIVEKVPLILKPSRGIHGRDIRIVSTPEDLVNIMPIKEPILVQEYVKGTGEDLKVYVIGNEVFATRKPFSPSSFTRPGRPCNISKEVRNISLRCGEVFRLGLYGLDIIENSSGPVVVDVNYFPGYKGIPNVAALLADYIKKYALGEHSINLATSETIQTLSDNINVQRPVHDLTERKPDLFFARRNIMTVDLEDYYCHLPISAWDKYESRVEKATRTVLDLFDKYKVNATFFTIGYIAEKNPELIQEIVSRGHEIASHGYSHSNVKNMSAKEFECDLERSREVLERISGEKVMGFRAPYCSINKQNLWTFDVMRKHRIRYDCSLCPVRYHYGLPEAPRHIYRMSYKDPLKEDPNSTFIEIPMTTLELPLIGNIPVGGGHYFRFLPCSVLKSAIKKFNTAGYPAVFYVHTHDLDPAKPCVPNAAWHNYWGLKEAADKFESILEDFRFCSAREVIT